MTRPLLFALVTSTALAAAPAAADPLADARAIIDATVTEDAVSGVLAAMGPVIFGAMENTFRANGIEVSDTETFVNIVVEEFMAGYIDAMRSEMATIYVEEFTAEELAGIADFYAAPAGQAMAAKTATLAQRGAQVGGRVGEKAALEVSDRVAARLRDEGVTVTADPAMQGKLLDLLDNMGR